MRISRLLLIGDSFSAAGWRPDVDDGANGGLAAFAPGVATLAEGTTLDPGPGHFRSGIDGDWITVRRLLTSSGHESRTRTRAYRGKMHKRWADSLPDAVTAARPGK